METALFGSLAEALPSVDDSTAQQVAKFWDSAEVFFDWERDKMILGNPTDTEKKDHRSMLKMLQLSVSLLRKLERNNQSLDMLQKRLDDSWGMFYNPMTDAEADAVLRQAFGE
jgi:hypothetical protein